MEACPFIDIEQDFDDTIAAIAAAQGIDPICSTSDWIVPVADAFAGRSESRVYAGEHGYVALLEHESPSGPILSSFDSVWGFASPLVGHDPSRLVTEAASLLGTLDYYVATISGLDPSGPLFDEVQQLGPVGFTDTADRCVVDLSDGFGAWIGRRSPRFRRSLRAAVHRGEATGVVVEHLSPTASDIDATFERILAIEKTSWKTDVSSGLIDTDLGTFTRAMCHRFAARGGLRVQFAQLDGVDIGYVIGARVNQRYRGFQHSFDQNYPDLSIGKLLQFHTISALADEGIHAYDMGMHMTYKESYADRVESTVTAIIPRR